MEILGIILKLPRLISVPIKSLYALGHKCALLRSLDKDGVMDVGSNQLQGLLQFGQQMITCR